MRLLAFITLFFGVVSTIGPFGIRRKESRDHGNATSVTGPQSGRGRGPGGRWGRLNETEKANFLKSFNRTDADKFHNALDAARTRIRNKLQLTSEQKKELTNRMKTWKNKTRSAHIKKEGDSLMEVNQNLGLTENFYQGDIVLTQDQFDKVLAPADDDANTEERTKRQAYKDSRYPNTIWGSTVYYYFDASLNTAARTAINLAIQFWQANTCINFVQSSTASNRIRFFPGSGCYSYVGRIGGQQDISIGQGCESMGTAAHEIGHALGFFHTQSRYDRNSFITVNFNNIPADWVDQFNIESSSTNYNYGMPYDYGSVMQYGGTSVSSNGQPTMVARTAPYQDTMGSDIVAFYDISMMNEHYQCKAKCTTGATCYNGGFRHPRNCNTCICPRGWAGTTCTTRPTGCGASYTATTTLQTITTTVGDDTTTVLQEFRECNWIITAPAGKKVEITLTAIVRQQCFDGCVYGGLEVKASADHRFTGIRYCCNEDKGTKIVSQSNVVPIIAFNRFNKNTYTISYRYVEPTVASTVTSSTPTTGATQTPVPAPAPAPTSAPVTACTDDSANCASWSANGFCTNAYYTLAQKKSYCAKTCKLC